MNKISKLYIYIFLIVFAILPLLTINKALIFVSLYLFLLTFLVSKIKTKHFPLYLFIGALFLRIIIIILIDTTPLSDFSTLYNASKSILRNDYSFNNDSYFYYWAYQMGFVYFQSICLRIINSITFLKVLNAIITSLICVLIYHIAACFMDDKYAKTSAIFYTLMIFPLTYVTVLTNQHLQALLTYLAIYLLISKDIKISEYKKYLFAGILIAFGNIIRPEGIIAIFSIVLYLILIINKRNYKDNIKHGIVLLTSYYLVLFICSNLFIITGVGPYGLKNNATYWKFVSGFNHETVGRYSDSDTYVLGNKDEAHELIKERVLVSPVKLGKLFIKKSNYFWNVTTLDWSLFEFYNKDITILNKKYKVESLATKLNSLNEKNLFIMYILLILGVYNYLKKKDHDKKIILLINLVFVTFGVYLLIEIQPRYAYFIHITCAILMGLGLEWTKNIIKNIRSSKL